MVSKISLREFRTYVVDTTELECRNKIVATVESAIRIVWDPLRKERQLYAEFVGTPSITKGYKK
jgi:hypothetical protein